MSYTHRNHERNVNGVISMYISQTAPAAPQYLIYLRKSRQDRDMERETGVTDTLQRHRDSLLALARRQGLSVAHIYEEVVSGDTIAERPEMQKLLAAVESGLYAGVLVMEVPRLARGNTKDQGIVAETFQYSGAKIITPDKTYDPSDEADQEYFEFGLFMSRREYKAINKRQQRGRMASLEEGKYIASSAPYGYEKVKLQKQRGYTLQVVPEQADVVRMIFYIYTVGELQADGSRRQFGSYTISNILNSRAIQSPSGNRWSPSAVREILNNPTYAGYVRWGRRAGVKRMADGVVIQSHPLHDTHKFIEGMHEAIISMDTWQTSQAILAQRSHSPVPVRTRISNPLAGLMICSACGRAVVGLRQRSGQLMLHCPTAGCPTVSSTLPEVECALLDGLQAWLAEYEVNAPAHQEANIAYQDSNPKRELARLTTALAAVRRQQDQLCDLLEQGLYDKDRFQERSRTLSSRVSALAEAIAQVQAQMEREQIIQENRNRLVPNLKRVLEKFGALPSPAAQNALLKQVLIKVVYFKTKGGRWEPSDLRLFLFPRIQAGACGADAIAASPITCV